MKIVRKTESELVAADSGLFLCWLFTAISVPLLIVGSAPGRHGVLLGAAFMLLFAAICLRKTTFTFDRTRGTAFWRKRKMFAVSSGEIPLRDISDIGFDSMPSQRGNPMYRLVVITASGRTPMADMYGGSQKYYESIRNAILEFLAGSGSPLNPVAANSFDHPSMIRALILEGRTIEAIKLLRTTESLDLAQAKARVDEIDRQMKANR
jgi:hypothetical protein